MRPGAAIIARALAQPPITGGMLPGITALWWRAPTPEEEWTHRETLRRLLSGEALDEAACDEVEGLLAALVCGWWGRDAGEDDLTPIGEPVPCRFAHGVVSTEQDWPWLPVDWLAPHRDVLLMAIVQAIAARQVAAAAYATTPPPAPPEGVAVPTCLGWVALRLAHLPALTGRQDLRDRCVAVGLAAWLGVTADRDASPDWLRLAADVSALVCARWTGSAWEPTTLAVQPSHEGGLWAGSLRAADLLALWRAGMAPALDAGDLVRRWLPEAQEGERPRPLPSADGGTLPWAEDAAWPALGPEARAWARAAWAVAWQRQSAALMGIPDGR